MKSVWLEKLAEDGVIRPHVKEAILRDCLGLVMDRDDLAKTAEEIRSAARSMDLEKVASTYADVLIVSWAGMNDFEKVAISSSLLNRASTKAKTLLSKGGLSVDKEMKLRGQAARFRDASAARLNKLKPEEKSYQLEKILSGKNNEISRLEKRLDSLSNRDRENTRQIRDLQNDLRSREKELSQNSQKSKPGLSTALNILRNAAVLAPVAMAGGAGAGLAKHMISLSDKKKLEARLKESFDTAMRMSDPEVEPLYSQPDKARQAFETLSHFAPHVASEPAAARAFMNRIVSYNQGIPTLDVKELTDIERNLAQARPSSTPFMSGFAGGAQALGLGKAVDLSYRSALDND